MNERMSGYIDSFNYSCITLCRCFLILIKSRGESKSNTGQRLENGKSIKCFSFCTCASSAIHVSHCARKMGYMFWPSEFLLISRFFFWSVYFDIPVPVEIIMTGQARPNLLDFSPLYRHHLLSILAPIHPWLLAVLPSLLRFVPLSRTLGWPLPPPAPQILHLVD